MTWNQVNWCLYMGSLIAIDMSRIITYNKLVRDKIPEIIEASGKKCDTAVLADKDFLYMLDKKLGEEVKEYQESHEVEELADVLEVIYAIAETKGVSKKQLEDIRAAKAEKRGAFEKKILLKSVTED